MAAVDSAWGIASRSGLLEMSYSDKVTSVCGEPEGSKDDVSGFLIRLERQVCQLCLVRTLSFALHYCSSQVVKNCEL